MNFTSRLTKGETIAALVWLPFHIIILPKLLGMLFDAGYIGESEANLALYAAGTVYMLLFLGRFLRREFDPLCERPFFCLLQAGGSYIAMIFFNWLGTARNVRNLVFIKSDVPVFNMMLFNAAFAAVLLLLSGEEVVINPNNQAVSGLAARSPGAIKAAGIFLAPIVEELIFRAGIFGTIRQKRRVLAYIVSMLAFGIYHVWMYLPQNPLYVLFIIQYLPASWLLCRCYEKTNTIWTPIFMHMLVNAVSMAALDRLAAI